MPAVSHASDFSTLGGSDKGNVQRCYLRSGRPTTHNEGISAMVRHQARITPVIVPVRHVLSALLSYLKIRLTKHLALDNVIS